MTARQPSRPAPLPALGDDVIWQALTTRQAGVARVQGPARKFIDGIGPLAAFTGDADAGYAALADFAAQGSVVAVFIDSAWRDRPGWTVAAQAPLVRMRRESRGNIDAVTPPGVRIDPLGDADSKDMQELASLARPGPFGPRTHQLGSFLGIRDRGRLVAMAGERMKVPGHTEVSAVCTHPDHTGKGYAAALMAKVIAGIEARGETAFLHSRADNGRALALYERLGFRAQRSGHFVALRRS
jgi:ribosomal protein S18 acetylase RimI-like enzyme